MSFNKNFKKVFDFLRFFVNLIYFTLFSVFVWFVYVLLGKDVSDKLRKTFFADFFTSQWMVGIMNGAYDEVRPKWLKGFTQLRLNIKDDKLKILEIGVGRGANFAYYPSNVRLTALDYNECFKEKFMKTLKNNPNIEFDGYLTGSMEDMYQIDDNSFDAVLITDVLCSVIDVQKGLSEIKRVLKKDGKLFFFEHVAYREHYFWSKFQKFVNPYWKIVMYNCHLTKQPWVQLEKADFKTIEINHSCPDVFPGFIRAHIYGWAQK